MDHNAPALEIRNVTKTFGDLTAVDDLSLSIPVGKITALLGHNGAGKSTLIDMILGLTKPDRGEIAVLDGTPEQAVADQRISAMMQSGGLLNDLTVAETLQHVAAASTSHLPVDEVIEQAGLHSFADRKVAKCSGGQIQRLRFGLALLPHPEIVLLDEPTAGLDAQAREEFWASMAHQAHQGRTIVFATHYLQEADKYAERVIIMKNGAITADGSLDELLTDRAAKLSGICTLNNPEDLLQQLGVEPHQWQLNTETSHISIQHPDSDRLAKELLNADAIRQLRITRPEVEDLFFEHSTAKGDTK